MRLWVELLEYILFEKWHVWNMDSSSILIIHGLKSLMVNFITVSVTKLVDILLIPVHVIVKFINIFHTIFRLLILTTVNLVLLRGDIWQIYIFYISIFFYSMNFENIFNEFNYVMWWICSNNLWLECKPFLEESFFEYL